MKRILSFLILILFTHGFVFASSIEDEFALSSLDKNLKVKKEAKIPIVDEFAIKTLNPNLKIKKQQTPIYEDELVKNLKNVKVSNQVKVKKYDFENLDVNKLKVSPSKYYTTRNNIKEGQEIEFLVKENGTGLNLKKGDIVKARIEFISKNGAYGVPGDMVVDNFSYGNKIFSGNLELKGANRSIWVYPLGYCLMPFFGAGIFIFPIRGGHAKLLPSKVYEVEI